MTSEHVQTTLRFIGDWPWWAGCGAALLLGGVSWFLYRRDALPSKWWVRALLPSLRAIAVMMMVLMLSGPVLHHRKIIGQLSRLFLFVDGSQSMGLTDSSMDLGRKILALERLSLLKPGSVPMELPHAGEALAEAQAAADTARLTPGIDTAEWNALVNEFSSKSAQARELFEKGSGEKERVERLTKDLIEPAKALFDRKIQQIDGKDVSWRDVARRRPYSPFPIAIESDPSAPNAAGPDTRCR